MNPDEAERVVRNPAGNNVQNLPRAATVLLAELDRLRVALAQRDTTAAVRELREQAVWFDECAADPSPGIPVDELETYAGVARCLRLRANQLVERLDREVAARESRSRMRTRR